MKKLLALALALCMVFSLVACGESSQTPATPGGSTEQAADDGQVYTMIVAHDETLDSILHTQCIAFKDRVEKESNGRIQVTLYANGELGDTEVLVDMIAAGSVQATGCSSSVLSPYNQRLSCVSLPFLFDNLDQAWEVAIDKDGELHKIYQEELNKAGYYLLGFQYQGSRGLSNNVRPVETAEDMKGLKLRVMNSEIAVATFEALGCNVTPMSYSEVYTALQQGVVDGQDNPPENTFNAKFNEVQKYYCDLNHDMNLSVFVCSYDWLMSLPEDLRQIVIDAGYEVGSLELSQRAKENYEATLDKINDSGCVVNRIADHSSFVSATQSVYDTMRAAYGDDFMDQVLSIVGKK